MMKYLCLVLFLTFSITTPYAQDSARSKGSTSGHDENAGAFGSISISSQPGEADVYLDNGMVGRTPLSLARFPAGHHTLQVTKDGYCDFNDSLDVVAGSEVTRTVRLDSACGFVVRSIPDSAAVYVQDLYIGKTPLTINIRKPGWATIKISKRDYALYQKNVLLEPGRTANIDAQLSARFGTFTLDSYANDMAVSIDGTQYDGAALHEQMLPAGNHDIVIHRPGSTDSIAQSIFLSIGEQSRWGVHFGRFTMKHCFQSMLLPGLGQMTDGALLKGVVMMAAFAASTAFAVLESNDYTAKVDDFNNAYNNYRRLTNEDAAKQARDALIDKHSSLNTSFKLRSAGIIAASSIYIFSVVDALLFHTRENVLEPLSSEELGLIHSSLVLSPSGGQCTLTIFF